MSVVVQEPLEVEAAIPIAPIAAATAAVALAFAAVWRKMHQHRARAVSAQEEASEWREAAIQLKLDEEKNELAQQANARSPACLLARPLARLLACLLAGWLACLLAER